MKKTLLCLMLIIYNIVWTQNYAISNISEELLTNSNSVIRDKHTQITLHSIDEIRAKNYIATTILNEANNSYNYCTIHFIYKTLNI